MLCILLFKESKYEKRNTDIWLIICGGVMESLTFCFNEIQYLMEYYPENKGEIKLYEKASENNIHLKGKQKSIIIDIMRKIIFYNKQAFNEEMTNYINIVYFKNKSNTIHTTRSLGYALFKYLRNNDYREIQQKDIKK